MTLLTPGRLLVIALLATTAACGGSPDAPSPATDATEVTNTAPSQYAGQEARQIKALSERQTADLLAGAGMGYAMVAELNGFPGPKHVLELADQLDLTADQRSATQSLFDRMQARASELGELLVEAERTLDALFVQENMPDSSAVVEAMESVAFIEATLRWTHVSAHLDQTAILSRHQRHQYVELRGYESMDHGAHKH